MRRLLVLGLSTLLALSVLAAACGDDDDDDSGGGDNADQQAVEDSIRAFTAAVNADDLDSFLAALTDDGFEAFTGGFFDDEDAFREAHDAGEFALNDEPAPEPIISEVEVSGDSATVRTESVTGQLREFDRIRLVREGDAWLLDGLEPLTVQAPEGTQEVEVSLLEFAFEGVPATLSAGDVAFQLSNDGEQAHELSLAKLPEGVSLDEALQAEDAEALGVEDIAFIGPLEPGQEQTSIIEDLEPGRYAYVCFFPDTDDPQETPHAFKGMVGEFTVS